jgi:curved DNA-binding protein CbpA
MKVAFAVPTSHRSMTPQPPLEITGNFLTHPFAELLTECSRARLTGSLRVNEREKKCIFYLKSGSLVFAVANSRSSRLFDLLIRRGKFSKEQIAKIPNFNNDFELSAYLQENELLSSQECNQYFVEQIKELVVEALTWKSSDWTFSPLARVRDGLAFPINTKSLLVDYGRCLSVQEMLGRFRSLEERFSRSNLPATDVGLSPDEAFVLSRAEDGQLTAAGLLSVSAMSEASALQAIYTLWLGGLLERWDWQPAFSEEHIATMKNARLELKKEAAVPRAPFAEKQEDQEPPAETPRKPAIVAEPEKPISTEEYLERVENAETYYDVLGVDAKADTDTLKRAYFGLARMFHPDRFHAEGGETFQRVQNAFTELAQANETLKNAETRELYDYRMRKELADREKRRAAGDMGQDALRRQQAAENFERGFDLLMNEEWADAAQFFARAVHLAPQTARYHAYYGKALSDDPQQRYKAESEMQTAIKLEPDNVTLRLLLVEFFIQFNLKKRAEGELNRLLTAFPGNKEALELLSSLNL